MNLNGKPTNPGEMRTDITIQSRTVSQSGGFQTPSWGTLATCKCRWTNVHGREVWDAAVVQAEMPATVLLRYVVGVNTSCAVLKGSERFEIVSVDNIQERNEYLELKVRKWRAG